MNKKALIIGHTGQDGFYLNEQLKSKGYDVLGLSSLRMDSNFLFDFPFGSINNAVYCDQLIQAYQPHEIYYLAAVHQSSIEENFDNLPFYKATLDVNANGLLNILNSVFKFYKESKVFYASSSHVFGGTATRVQNEETAFSPVSIYGISKVLGMHFCDLYRHKGIFCSSGIFYNHESPRRDLKFVSRKIVQSAVSIALGRSDELVLGDLNASIDWGYAPDYMDAAFQILQCRESSHFIVSSGTTHQVKDFVSLVFKQLGLNMALYVKENKDIILKRSTTILQGDHTKLTKMTGWSPSVSFEKMVEILVQEELNENKV